MRLPLLAALVLAACASPRNPPGSTTDGSTGLDCEPGTDGCGCPVEGDGCLGELVCSGNVCVDPTRTTSDPGSSGGDGSSSTGEASTGSTDPASSSSGASTGDAGSCGDGIVDPARGEACDNGQETKLCDDDCSPVECGDGNVNEAAGEDCDDGNVDNTDACLDDCTAASCGDGFIGPGETCDDGDALPDGLCNETCTELRWEHVGPAVDVPLDSLHRWELCWASTYADAGPVADVSTTCLGDHLLVACRPANATSLSVVAHAPRADVLFVPEVDYAKGARHEANGTAWYWAPSQTVVGFGPGGSSVPCNQGDESTLCWKVFENNFMGGGRCGAKNGFTWAEEPMWERLVFQAWD